MPNPVFGKLSNTYRSDNLFTPLDPARETSSKFLYSTGVTAPEPTGAKWGRNDYGVMSADNATMKVKGHRHFTAGFEMLPGDIAQYQVYDLTALKRSNTRPQDHLVKEPQKINIQESQIHLPFPQQHKYFSHLSHKDIFPQHKPPTKSVAVVEDEVDDAEESDGEYDVPPTLAFDREHRPLQSVSTKGDPWRSEKLTNSWRPGPVPRPAEQKVSAATFNDHKQYLSGLKQTHYSRTHGTAITAVGTTTTTSLSSFKPDWKHEILKKFNEKHNEPLPDIRRPKEKRHIFNGVHTLQIEHG